MVAAVGIRTKTLADKVTVNRGRINSIWDMEEVVGVLVVTGEVVTLVDVGKVEGGKISRSNSEAEIYVQYTALLW